MTAFASYRAAVNTHFYRICKLVECAEYFGYSYTTHDSREDASVTLACFNRLIDDPRFTANKRKKQVKEEIQQSSIRSKTHFTIQFSTHRRNSILFGTLLVLIAEGLLYYTRNILITDFQYYYEWIKALPILWTTNRMECVLHIVFGIGCLFIIGGVIRLIFRLPRILIAKGKHFANHFKNPGGNS